MKVVVPSFCALISVAFPFAVLANTERPYQQDTANPEIKSMSFEECIDMLHSYEKDIGPAHVILDTPALRIVQFTISDETEQVACDGDSHVMSVLDIDDK